MNDELFAGLQPTMEEDKDQESRVTSTLDDPKDCDDASQEDASQEDAPQDDANAEDQDEDAAMDQDEDAAMDQDPPAEDQDASSVQDEAAKPIVQEKLTRFPLSRIKTIMKLDPDTSVASQDAIFLIAKVRE